MRPHNTDRDAALACGDKHFEGNPCKHCGGTLRYTRNYTCVNCMSDHNRARYENKAPEPQVIASSLAEARKNKNRFYHGRDCNLHPGQPRYTSNGHCVICKKSLDQDRFDSFEGKPCAKGHTTRYVSTGRCVECHRAQCQEHRADGGGAPTYGTQKRREEREMRKRLAMIRAERTARQKACAYGVRA